MNIELFSKMEESLFERMPANGHFASREKFISENGLYQEWAKIFEGYANLAGDGNLEATKRAIFFLWYQVCEPSQLSGIRELNETLVEAVLNTVDAMAKNQKLDLELKWMLPYYFSVADYYFERFSGLTFLKRASLENVELWKEEIKNSRFERRGQLGKYWKSIATS